MSLQLIANASLDIPADAPGAAESDIKQFLKAWAWKREHRPDKHDSPSTDHNRICKMGNSKVSSVTCMFACGRRARFKKPYTHKLCVGNDSEEVCLTIKQAKFEAEGFASTGKCPYLSYMEHAPDCMHASKPPR